MKRSEINDLLGSAEACFRAHGWALPPSPKWDVTDFGLGEWSRYGLILINLAEEPEYCEKLMYARRNMTTPAHTHLRKKEDIICRWGELNVLLWNDRSLRNGESVTVKRNGELQTAVSGEVLPLHAGERITLVPGMYHEFFPKSEECIIGEVSTANDDRTDNLFVNPEVGRFPEIDEDVPALIKLLSDH